MHSGRLPAARSGKWRNRNDEHLPGVEDYNLAVHSSHHGSSLAVLPGRDRGGAAYEAHADELLLWLFTRTRYDDRGALWH